MALPASDRGRLRRPTKKTASTRGRLSRPASYSPRLEMLEDRFVPELFGHIVRRDMETEHPLVNCSAALRIVFGEEFVVDADANTVRVGVEMPASKSGVAEGCSHENVGLAAAFDQVTRDLLPIAHHVLSRRGFVIDIARVNIRALIQQALRNLDGTGKMERGLAISPACVYERGIA